MAHPLYNTLYPTGIFDETATEIIIKEKYWDCAFALDVNMFKAHQAKDTNLHNMIRKAKTKPVSTFLTKDVKGVELINYNNKTVVLGIPGTV